MRLVCCGNPEEGGMQPDGSIWKSFREEAFIVLDLEGSEDVHRAASS